MIDDILNFNKGFVQKEGYSRYIVDKYPQKKIAIVSCMDTRLIELLPAALGVKNGDAKMIKNAGGVISHPFGSVMRSLLIGIYELEIQEILIIGHTDCGARSIDSHKMLDKMRLRGITQQNIDMVSYCGINFETWLGGFRDLDTTIQKSVEFVRKHPLIPTDIKVYGLVIDSVTGELRRVKDC